MLCLGVIHEKNVALSIEMSFFTPKKHMLLCSREVQIEAACPGATTRGYDPISQLYGYLWL